jgi:hypothetical protein
MFLRILRNASAFALIVTPLVWSAVIEAAIQQRGQPPRTARESAPVDLSGYWVSVVSEDWRFRMITPPKGDYSSIPLNNEGRRVADLWTPEAGSAPDNRCKAYGVGGIMRAPGRLHVTWQDDNTLKVETDAGAQTRLLAFGAAPAAGPARLQGYSAATWEGPAGRGQPQRGSLKVVTTRMLPGYLRLNGVPYSENAVITEYFDHHMNFGAEWFTVTTIVEDPVYLTQPFITSTDFRREPDGSRWSPATCAAGR